MNKSQRINKLKKEIEKLEMDLLITERWDGEINKKDFLSPEEKVKVFDELYDNAINYMKTLSETGLAPKDFAHYTHEYVMQKCLGENIFNLINKFFF